MTAGGTKVFEVVSAELNTANGELTLSCRDGRVCLGLVGAWEYAVTSSILAPMSIYEVERIHNGEALVTVT
jgi:hypothetical protein